MINFFFRSWVSFGSFVTSFVTSSVSGILNFSKDDRNNLSDKKKRLYILKGTSSSILFYFIKYEINIRNMIVDEFSIIALKYAIIILSIRDSGVVWD